MYWPDAVKDKKKRSKRILYFFIGNILAKEAYGNKIYIKLRINKRLCNPDTSLLFALSVFICPSITINKKNKPTTFTPLIRPIPNTPEIPRSLYGKPKTIRVGTLTTFTIVYQRSYWRYPLAVVCPYQVCSPKYRSVLPPVHVPPTHPAHQRVL
jgi:hypothetical protein